MQAPRVRQNLFVEGTDDQHVIIQLMERNGHSMKDDARPFDIKPQESDFSVLKVMPLAIRAATGVGVGFVLDADTDIKARWDSIRRIIELETGEVLPRIPERTGLILNVRKYNTRVGVWLMPDNEKQPGRLEDFLETLVPPNDSLFGYARSATTEAHVRFGAKFPASHHLKAVLHAWLAWQQVSGLPFGTALKAHYFLHDSDVASIFLKWLRELFVSPSIP